MYAFTISTVYSSSLAHLATYQLFSSLFSKENLIIPSIHNRLTPVVTAVNLYHGSLDYCSALFREILEAVSIPKDYYINFEANIHLEKWNY